LCKWICFSGWNLSAETGYIKARNVRMNYCRLVMIPNSVIPLSRLYKQHWVGIVDWTCTMLTLCGFKESVFWDIMPYNLLKVNLCFRVTCYLHPEGWKINPLLAASFTQVTCSPESCIDFQRTSWHYIPEDRTPHTFAVRTSWEAFICEILAFHRSQIKQWQFWSVKKKSKWHGLFNTAWFPGTP
jgi:hypothetical protein